ncbi:helix-turn-helix transcriptional regulator [Pinibacter aurantiacus]|jgi:AraC-like DNA-binding protein|uniref:AraC family transcriptional regulator n=1 Tax=Pinibacter aurantiacus TaxID=2851599 RepID=A0A9E2W5D1_9BACT|nr:helix-turn-helix domain-containing protein [Pinibacter aurantiacus]MBV4358774.1 AraC family transcriptional regulator [Pinibacter aurantiacus]
MVQISSPQHGTLSLLTAIPPNFTGLVLPGGNVCHYQGDIGYIVLQERVSEHFTIKYNQFTFKETGHWQIQSDTEGTLAFASLRETFKATIKDLGKMVIRESQFIFLHTAHSPTTFLFEKGKKYYDFEIWFSADFIARFIPYFISLQNALQKIYTNQLHVIGKSRYAGKVASGIIQDILRCPYIDEVQELYFETKAKEYLLALLSETFKEKPSIDRFTTRELDAIYSARSIIRADIKNHVSIPDIAKKVGLNEFTLKAGFRATFGTTLFECLTNARMETAKSLLTDTNEPMKAIAAVAGYGDVTNFITAFRKYFGFTPASLRRK